MNKWGQICMNTYSDCAPSEVRARRWCWDAWCWVMEVVRALIFHFNCLPEKILTAAKVTAYRIVGNSEAVCSAVCFIIAH